MIKLAFLLVGLPLSVFFRKSLGFILHNNSSEEDFDMR